MLLVDVSGGCMGVKRVRTLNKRDYCSAELDFAGAVAFLRPGSCILGQDFREALGAGQMPNTAYFVTKVCSYTLSLIVESKQQDDQDYL